MAASHIKNSQVLRLITGIPFIVIPMINKMSAPTPMLIKVTIIGLIFLLRLISRPMTPETALANTPTNIIINPVVWFPINDIGKKYVIMPTMNNDEPTH
jgi:hypothetical protein